MIGDAPLMALLQSTIPPHQQGCALSLLTTLITLGAPVGLALATPVGELIGMHWLFVLVGTLVRCVSLFPNGVIGGPR